jgi:hypothetical protein
VIHTYNTLAGARKKRREIGGQIIRVLCDPDEVFVVAPSYLCTRIFMVGDDGASHGSIWLTDMVGGYVNRTDATGRRYVQRI